MYLFITTERVLICLLIVAVAFYCLIGIIKSRTYLEYLKKEEANFVDEYIIAYKSNRFLVIILCLLTIARLLIIKT